LVQAGVTQTIGKWDAGVQLRYAGERSDAAQTLSAYSLVDLTASQSLTPDVSLNLRIENAGNVSYQSIYGYNMPKRGLFAGLKWTPKF
jgi:vitamin B12 transporter